MKPRTAVGLILTLGTTASPTLAEPISLSDRNMDFVTLAGGDTVERVLEATDKETISEINALLLSAISADTAVAFPRNSNDASLEETSAAPATSINLTTSMAGAGGEANESVIASTNTFTAQSDTTATGSSASSAASAAGPVGSNGSTSSVRKISSSESIRASGGLQAKATATSISTSSSISSTANVAARVASATQTLGRSGSF